MKINVKVKVSARENKVEQLENGDYFVYTTASPIQNRANEVIIELLAEYFGIDKSRFKLIRGIAGKNKIIEVRK